MNPVVELKREWFRELEDRDPERYREILDRECPHDYMLPSSYRDTYACGDCQTCKRCWKEALGE